MARIPDAVLVLDADAAIVTANHAFLAQTGHGLDRLIGEPFADRLLLPDRRLAPALAALARVIAGDDDNARFELALRDADDAAQVRSVSAFALPPGPAALGRVAVVFGETAANQAARADLLLDPVTRLPNRALFEDRARRELMRAERDGSYVGILVFDIDRFTPTTDAFGRAFGDVLLAETAKRLAGALRPWDSVARMGDDDNFAIAIGGLSDPRHVEPVAERVLAAISGPVEHGGRATLLTGSIGIALYPRDGDNLPALLDKATAAMRATQKAGGGDFSYVTRSLQLLAQRRIDLQRDLRRAVVDGGFELDYQPIVDLRSGKAVAIEALLRWRHPTKGMVPPLEVLKIADEIGLGPTIGDWVANRALSDLSEIRTAGAPQLRMVLNKTPDELARDGVVDAWLASVRQHGLPPEAVVLDLVEGHFLDRDRDFLPEIARWRAAGGIVALDDFSVGAVSLMPLRKRAVDWIKLDRTLVHGLPDDDNAALIDATVALAHQLGVLVVAEGAENDEQTAFLKAKGCDMVQGFLYAPPMSVNDLVASIRR
jgi:diguanylate cyclase (GGDEF)-like protein